MFKVGVLLVLIVLTSCRTTYSSSLNRSNMEKLKLISNEFNKPNNTCFKPLEFSKYIIVKTNINPKRSNSIIIEGQVFNSNGENIDWSRVGIKGSNFGVNTYDGSFRLEIKREMYKNKQLIIEVRRSGYEPLYVELYKVMNSEISVYLKERIRIVRPRNNR